MGPQGGPLGFDPLAMPSPGTLTFTQQYSGAQQLFANSPTGAVPNMYNWGWGIRSTATGLLTVFNGPFYAYGQGMAAVTSGVPFFPPTAPAAVSPALYPAPSPESWEGRSSPAP